MCSCLAMLLSVSPFLTMYVLLKMGGCVAGAGRYGGGSLDGCPVCTGPGAVGRVTGGLIGAVTDTLGGVTVV